MTTSSIRFLALASLLLGACSEDGPETTDTGTSTDAGETEVAAPEPDAVNDTPIADVAEDTDETEDTDPETDAPEDADAAEDTGEADAEPDVPTGPQGEPVEGPAAPEPEADTTSLGADGPCGSPVIYTGRGLKRAPYVQSVFTDTGRLAWTDTLGAEGFVHFSVAGSDEWFRVAAEARELLVAETGTEEDYTAYDATLMGLPADSDICYEIYVDGALLVSGAAFHTAWTTHDKPVRILAMGDSGNGSAEQLAVRDRMMEVESDLFLHLGDMAYGSGTYTEFEAYVFDVYTDLMAAIPAWPTPGNHEYKTGLADGYIGVYYLPEQAPNPLEQEYYYSFDYGNVHFISIDSNEFRYLTTIGPSEEDMLGWLANDLEESADAEWKIAFMHHPPYSSGSHGNTNWLLEIIVPMLEDAGVDLVLAGHDHQYERSHEIFEGEIAEVPGALTYIVAGSGGAGVRDATWDNWWTAEMNDTIHNFLYLEIDGCTATGTAIDVNGETVDAFEMTSCDD